MYDCAIIGTGPAGLSAAINLKLHKKDFVWFGSKRMSEKAALAEKVANYPGLPMVSGTELTERFAEHVRAMDLEITDKMVSQIMSSHRGFMVLADNEIYEAKTLILAIGVATAKEIPGEKGLVGHGVSYCATCDGFLYKGKTIGVLCTAERFAHEITYLAQIAEKVYLFPYFPFPTVTGLNIERIPQKIKSVNGGNHLESVTLADGTTLSLNGLFCMRDSIAPAVLLPQIAVEKGQILVARNMATNLPGCFACGDCTGAPYQFAKAVGEGNVAAHSVIRYLSDSAQ